MTQEYVKQRFESEGVRLGFLAYDVLQVMQEKLSRDERETILAESEGWLKDAFTGREATRRKESSLSPQSQRSHIAILVLEKRYEKLGMLEQPVIGDPAALVSNLIKGLLETNQKLRLGETVTKESSEEFREFWKTMLDLYLEAERPTLDRPQSRFAS